MRNGFEFYFETDAERRTALQLTSARRNSMEHRSPTWPCNSATRAIFQSFAAQLRGQQPALRQNRADRRQGEQREYCAGRRDRGWPNLAPRMPTQIVAGPLAALVTPKDAPAQMLILGPPTSNTTEMQTLPKPSATKPAGSSQREGEINSEAYQAVLRPHRLVLVKGAGKAYSGKYYVTRVVHELRGDGSYAQSFEARRNARDIDGSERFGSDGLGLAIRGSDNDGE